MQILVNIKVQNKKATLLRVLDITVEKTFNI